MSNNNHILTRSFSALGDPTRFAIVNRLIEQGPQSAGQLGDVADISAPAMSRHLKVLHDAGIVTRRIDAQRRIYAVDPKAIRAIGEWTMTREEFWTASLDRLAALLDASDDTPPASGHQPQGQ